MIIFYNFPLDFRALVIRHEVFYKDPVNPASCQLAQLAVQSGNVASIIGTQIRRKVFFKFSGNLGYLSLLFFYV